MKSATVFVTGRLAFCHLHKMTYFEGSKDGRYETQVLIDPDSASAKELNASVDAIKTATFKGKLPAEKICVRPGEDYDYDSHQGQIVLRCSRKRTPPLLLRADGKTRVETDDGTFFAGAICKVKVRLWAQDNQFGKRINAELQGVQFIADDGTSFGAGGNPSDDGFGDETAAAAGFADGEEIPF